MHTMPHHLASWARFVRSVLWRCACSVVSKTDGCVIGRIVMLDGLGEQPHEQLPWPQKWLVAVGGASYGLPLTATENRSGDWGQGFVQQRVWRVDEEVPAEGRHWPGVGCGMCSVILKCAAIASGVPCPGLPSRVSFFGPSSCYARLGLTTPSLGTLKLNRKMTHVKGWATCCFRDMIS